MDIGIEFTEGYREKALPVIKLTRSRNGKTGTATFIFIEPCLFHRFYGQTLELTSLSLIWNEEKITTHDISIFFKDGKPFLLKGIFLFKNSIEWFNFLNFMRQYSNETGLAFSEK
jgi:photosystem II protein